MKYTTTFVKMESGPYDPHIDEFLKIVNEHFNKMANEGWKLISSNEILRGDRDAEAGYSLTAGICYYWKKE